MNVFELRERLINDYSSYIRSFIRIRDERIEGLVSPTGRRGEEPLAVVEGVGVMGGAGNRIRKGLPRTRRPCHAAPG